MNTHNHILHIDMDAFYASVEQRDNPQYLGKPLIVGGTSNRGVVSSASYEAREWGVRSAMPIVTAKKLCPQGIFVHHNISTYQNDSKQIMEIMNSYTPMVEPVSLDEAYLDVSGSERLFGDAVTIGKAIQKKIYDQLQLHASVGIAPNKFLAKIASDLKKPKGFCIINWEDRIKILDPLSIRAIGGIGKKTELKFKSLGVKIIQDIRKLPFLTLKNILGNQAEHFINLINGEDNSKVTLPTSALSIGKETTFFENIFEEEKLHQHLIKLSDQVTARLRKKKIGARTITVKIKYSDFQLETRSATQENPTNNLQAVYKISQALLQKFAHINKKGVRLIGISTTHLTEENSGQLYLFEEDQHEVKNDKLNKIMDTIREKYGTEIIMPGASLKAQEKKSTMKKNSQKTDKRI